MISSLSLTKPAPYQATRCRKGTLAGVLAHLRSAPANRTRFPSRAALPRRCAACATILLVLALSGCGFSGALYLPEETPPAPQEQPVPEDEGPEAGAEK